MSDAVNHPAHYNAHPLGVECIEVVEQLPFCQGNAIKYLWRADHKGAALQDLKKALWYVDRARTSRDAVTGYRPPASSLVLARAIKGFSKQTAAAIALIASGQFGSAAHELKQMIAALEGEEEVVS